MANLSTKTGLPSFAQDQSSFINYFQDPGFERGVNGVIPTGWAQYNNGLALPGNGTGGAAVAQVTMLCSNSSPIRGTLSAVITKDANVRTGVGYAYPFTISQVDKGMTSGVDIEMVTSAGYQSGYLLFYIYDVTNSLLVTPTIQALPKLDSYGHFFSNYGLTAGTSYRFIFHIADTSATAWTVKMDTMINSTTRVAVPGPDVGNSIRYTPTVSTGTWAFTNGVYQKNGPYLDLTIYAGPLTANGSGIYTWTLPTGLTADLDALGVPAGIVPTLVDTDGGNNILIRVGEAIVGTQNGPFYCDGITQSIMDPRVVLASTTSIAIVTGGLGATPNRANVLGSVDAMSGPNPSFQLHARIPITQWAGSGVNFINQNTQSPIRAGTITPFAGATIPTGWLDCDGSAKLITDYPQLYAQLSTTWNTCTNTLTGVANSAPAAGSFRVPDLRGAFMRGAGTFTDGIGTDTTLAGYQGDQFQGHYHNVEESGAGGAANPSGYVTPTNGNASTSTPGTNLLNWKATTPISDPTNGTPRIGKENRPRNVGVRYIIKAFDESFNLAGFAAATATTMGLVQGGAVPGSTSGAAIAAGYVGEPVGTPSAGTGGALYGKSSVLVPGTGYTDLVTQTFNKGTYFASFHCRTAGSTHNLNCRVMINAVQATTPETVTAVLSTYDAVWNFSAPLVITADGTVVAISALYNGTVPTQATNVISALRVG